MRTLRLPLVDSSTHCPEMEVWFTKVNAGEKDSSSFVLIQKKIRKPTKMNKFWKRKYLLVINARHRAYKITFYLHSVLAMGKVMMTMVERESESSERPNNLPMVTQPMKQQSQDSRPGPQLST